MDSQNSQEESNMNGVLISSLTKEQQDQLLRELGKMMEPSLPGRERIPDPLPVPQMVTVIKTGADGFSRWMLANLVMAADHQETDGWIALNYVVSSLCEARVVAAEEIIWFWRYMSVPDNCQRVFQMPGVWCPRLDARDHEWWLNNLEHVELHASDWLNMDEED